MKECSYYQRAVKRGPRKRREERKGWGRSGGKKMTSDEGIIKQNSVRQGSSDKNNQREGKQRKMVPREVVSKTVLKRKKKHPNIGNS